MSKPKIFVSSTHFGLVELRDNLRDFIANFGCDPIFSDFNDIFYDPNDHTHVNCIKAIPDADMIVLLIGGRFGGKAISKAYNEINFDSIGVSNEILLKCINEHSLSITQLEVLKGIECNIPIYTLVYQPVYNDHLSYEKNKKSENTTEFKYGSIEKDGTGPIIFEFINLLRKRDVNNVLQEYNTFKDIKAYLTSQWSGYLKSQLLQVRNKKKSNYVYSRIVNHHSTERRNAFDELFTEVDSKDEIRILGTGVTTFLKRTEDVETYLKDENHIKILLINDQMVKTDWACSSKEFIDRLNAVLVTMDSNGVSELEAKTNCPLASNNILIDESHFNNYYNRKAYINEVRKSYELINDYKTKIHKEKWLGTLDVRHFHSFVPMSITAILPDHTTNRKLLAEFIIPFTEKRIILKSSQNENKDIYNLFISFFDETWKRALPLKED